MNVADPVAAKGASELTILLSRRVLWLFLGALGITLALYFWILDLRASPLYERLTPMFQLQFRFLDNQGALCVTLLLIVAILVPLRFPASAVLRWIGEHPVAMAVATTALLLLGAWFVHHRYPLTMDEYAPYFQSQVFIAGHLASQMPVQYVDWFIPEADQLFFFYVSHQTGQVISFYWPSFALLLAPFMWLGIPWALNPVLSGLTVLVMHRLAMRIFASTETAGLVTLLLIASPVFFADGITFYSMTAHMLANGLFALLLLDPTPRRLACAGFVGSIALTLHNPIPHILFAVPWLAWTVLGSDTLRRTLWLALGYLPLCVVLGVGWYLLGQSMVHSTANVVSPADIGVAGYFQLPDERIFLARAIGYAKVWLWAAPALVLLAAAGAWRWRQSTPARLFIASALLTVVGYFFMWVEQGHGWGFRYFHSAWLALPLLAAAAVARVPGQPGDAWTSDRPLLVFIVAGGLLSVVAHNALRALQIEDFVSGHLAQTPVRPGSGPRDARVEIYDPGKNFYVHDLVQNDPFLRGPVIRVLTHGEQANAQFMRDFRPGYVRTYVGEHGEVWEPPTASAR